MPVVLEKINLFDTNAGVLVNPVNTRGISGCNLALEFKKRFPFTQLYYEDACKKKLIKLGYPYIVKNADTITGHIIYFPTKIAPDRKEVTKLSTISNGLQVLEKRCHDFFDEGSVIALPKLGCGAGGLGSKEDIVIDLICKSLSEVSQKVILCV
jgi:hypothetical protein